jgi:hypothetical protein
MRLRDAALASTLAAFGGLVLAWQGGGAIGSGRLSTFGASPWQFGLAAGGALAAVSAASLSSLAALAWWRNRTPAEDADAPAVVLTAVPAGVRGETPDGSTDAAESDSLAG